MSSRRQTAEEREAERNFQFYEEREEPVPAKKDEKEPAEDGWYEGDGCPNCTGEI